MVRESGLGRHYDESLKCVRCGLCQAVCPVFGADHREASVARGKVQLVRAVLEERLDLSASLRDRIYLCLNCGACTENCPSGVAVADIIAAARGALLARLGQPAVERLLLRSLLAHPERLEMGATALALYERTGLRWLTHKLGLLNLMPGSLATKENFIPAQLARQPARRRLPATTSPAAPKHRVAYFLGCLTNVLYPSLAESVVEVLVRNGCQVVTAPDMLCCGLPHRSYGDVATAAKLEAHNTARLNALKVEAIVTDCATCGSTLKGYADLEAPVFDVNEFLAEKVALVAPTSEQPLRVTYHDSCHLGRGQGVRAAPRQLLQAAPGVELVEMPEADRCCGGAGTFSLMHYEHSMAILDRKMANAAGTEAEVLATGCPSCRMQLEHGLTRLATQQPGSPRPREVLHPVELLARAYRMDGR
ncbi:MAG: (Fe-S)-binding protein [Dehalococcoidales bacterium]|nr:(Fe-S)-binding protein [Dehalococcoidales bacterium]